MPAMPAITRQRASVLVLAFLGLILAGLGAVGIRRMRESADAASCRNKLRQLGLSLQNYQDANGKLPPLFDQGEGTFTGRGLPSVFALLMPYIEATPLLFRTHRPPDEYHAHSSIPFTWVGKQPGELGTHYGGMANHSIRIFFCPVDHTADKLQDIPMTLPDGSVGYYATGSYAANRALPWGAKRLPESANVVVFAERPQVCRTLSGKEVFNLWGLGSDSPHAPVFRADATPDQAFQWVRPKTPCDSRVPGTGHRSGIQTAIADASVRVFAHGTDPAIFRAACAAP